MISKLVENGGKFVWSEVSKGLGYTNPVEFSPFCTLSFEGHYIRKLLLWRKTCVGVHVSVRIVLCIAFQNGCKKDAKKRLFVQELY